MLRILIADDNQATRRMLVEIIESHEGWMVCDQAQDGREAILKTAECRPDVVVLDIAMPAKDGLSAAREIGAHLPAPIIVFCTLHDSKLIELEARKAGVSAVVPKIDAVAALCPAIEKILHERMATAPAAIPTAIVTKVDGPLADSTPIKVSESPLGPLFPKKNDTEPSSEPDQ